LRAGRSGRGARPVGRPGLVVLALVACGWGLIASPTALAHSTRTTTANPGSCPGASQTPNYSGSLSVEGGPLAASAAGGVGITYSYLLETNLTLPDGSYSLSCSLKNGTTTTDASGGFGFSIVPPGQSCWEDPPLGFECATYAGPFGPVSVGVAAPTPAGYGLASRTTGSVHNLTWVAELSSVSVTPTGSPLALSINAPTEVVGVARAANGTRSPLAANFTWGLNGSGWSFVGAPGPGGSATIVAEAGAPEGSLSVSANASVGATTFQTPTVRVALVAVATAIRSGSLDSTLVDTGEPETVDAIASGAPGVPYTATVDPGLGLAPFSSPCRAVAPSGAAELYNCTTSVTFSGPGSTEIALNVSNGHAWATWTSPSVTVDAATGILVDPAAPIGYAGASIPVDVSALPGSGTPPYRSACFVTGTAASRCSTSPGPNWTFDPTFAAPGNYSTTASILDSSGTNLSRVVFVRVVAPLSVAAVAPDVANVTVGTPVTLPSDLVGGALPAEVWWNASGANAPLVAYSTDQDGPLAATFTPSALGSEQISVTVRDSLGTEREASRALAVVIGDATALSASALAAPAGVGVGEPTSLAWQALDAVGRAVTVFSSGGTLTVTTGSATPALAWANVSGAGPLSAGPEGSFVVPASAWTAGAFNLTLTPLTAGTIHVTLSGPGILGNAPELGFTATPDLRHLRLFDPTVTLAGDRSNRTFWLVSDRYGNPVPGAYLVIQYTSAGSAVDAPALVESLAGGGTGVWLNYTLAGPGTSVRVLDGAGDVLVGPVTWTLPVVPSTTGLSESVLAGAGVAGAFGAFFSSVPRRRARAKVAGDDEAAARRLALGRAAIVEIVTAAGSVPRETIEDLWEPPPPPPDLSDWIASLVADGTLVGRSAPSGRVAYALASPAPESPQVVVDPTAIDRALARREEALRTDESSER
jgi:hypothetical protein